MKEYVWMAMAALLLAGCTQKKVDALSEAFQNERDSLNRVIEQKEHEINDMVGTMNDVTEGFRLISEAEERVSIARNDEGLSAGERIRENMALIQQTMQQNRLLINKLRGQLRQSSVRGEQLQRTLDNLTAQLEEKDQRLKALQAELEAKDIRIGELNEQVADLSTHVSSLRQETAQKSQTITSQDKQLNTAWYVFGTKKELREQHIVDDGKVLQSNFNRDYFTRIDIRVDKEIRLYSRSAKLLTSHPASSYTLQQDAKKQYILRIDNPQLFWSTSKYLVVLVK